MQEQFKRFASLEFRNPFTKSICKVCDVFEGFAIWKARSSEQKAALKKLRPVLRRVPFCCPHHLLNTTKEERYVNQKQVHLGSFAGKRNFYLSKGTLLTHTVKTWQFPDKIKNVFKMEAKFHRMANMLFLCSRQNATRASSHQRIVRTLYLQFHSPVETGECVIERHSK